MTKTKTEEFWVLLRVLKYSGVPHFVTPENKTSVEVLEARRYSSLEESEEALPEIQKAVGLCSPKRIVLTVSYSMRSFDDPGST